MSAPPDPRRRHPAVAYRHVPDGTHLDRVVRAVHVGLERRVERVDRWRRATGVAGARTAGRTGVRLAPGAQRDPVASRRRPWLTPGQQNASRGHWTEAKGPREERGAAPEGPRGWGRLPCEGPQLREGDPTYASLYPHPGFHSWLDESVRRPWDGRADASSGTPRHDRQQRDQTEDNTVFATTPRRTSGAGRVDRVLSWQRGAEETVRTEPAQGPRGGRASMATVGGRPDG